MLKKKFVYEVKRPRKDKKLPVILSKEEVAGIPNSINNLKHRVGEVVELGLEDTDIDFLKIIL